ncbi:MAG: PAS domain-containing protein [Nostocaceae cyanobacterium]|nr:PAS domain-containing protein [Nostocaceae cyanobacterium]
MNGNPLILVVEDDNILRLQLSDLMEQSGYRVTSAPNGLEALAVFRSQPPDIVLLDALMPVMDGFTCCKELQTLPGGDRTPVLMITALYDQDSVEEAFASGASDFVTKPIHWAVLRHRIQRLLEASRAMQELRKQSEQAQLQSAQLQMTLEAAHMGTWNWDILSNKITWSGSLETIYGWEADTEGSYEMFLQCVHPQDRDFVTKAVSQALDEGAEYDIEFRLILPSGNIRWLATKGHVFRDPSGQPVRMFGVDMDITKRKQVEAELRESQLRWELCLRGTNDGIWDWNLKTNEVFFSTRWKEMLGYADHEISNHLDEWSSRVHPDDLGWVTQAIQDHFAHKTPFYITEHRVCCKDGTYKWILDRGQALWDENGNVVRMAGSHTDITERKQAEEALRESEQRLQAILDNSSAVIFLKDLQGRYILINRQYETLFHIERGVIAGKTDYDVFPAEIAEAFRVNDQQVIATGSSLMCEELAPHPDGLHTYLSVKFPLYDATQAAYAICSISTDITERKQASEELQRQNLRSQLFADITYKIRQSLQVQEILNTSVSEVQKLLNADRVLIFQLSTDGAGVVLSEAVMPGFPVVLGQNIFDPCFAEQGYVDKYRQGNISAISDVEQANIQPCHVEFLQQFAVKANLVVPILLKDDLWGLLIAHQCAHPRQWESFEVELLCQLADQIGIALAQAEMLEAQTRHSEELMRSNAELQQFAFIASHDLQEPLRKILAFGNRLKATCRDSLNEQGLDYLQRMENAAERMQTLIEDLLALSRVTTRAQPFVAVNLREITQEVLLDLEVRREQSQGTVQVGELPTLDADPLQMRQLLQNLIGNALKFSRPGITPFVKVYCQFSSAAEQSTAKVSANGDYCQLIVEDNGIGFDEKYLDRIFQVFQRLHSRSQYEGTGIGLAICRKIAERHNGNITAKSTTGGGAKFIVTLPMKQRKGENPG